MKKLSKAQKDVIEKMRNGEVIKKRQSPPYGYFYLGTVKSVHKLMMNNLIEMGIIEIIEAPSYLAAPVTLTALGKQITI